MGMIREYFTFDSRPSTDFGVWISGGGTFNAPRRDLEYVSVPGRNGDLIFDNGRYENITVTYPAFIPREFAARSTEFRAWICSKIGYKRLEDTYHPDEFRIGSYAEGFDADTTPRNLGGSFNLSFNCKPQRFLKVGEIPVDLTSGTIAYNPTEYTAKPLLRLYGTGTVTIGGIRLTVTAANQYTDIDCDTMEAYKGAANCNGNVVLPDGVFPELAPGENAVTITGFSSAQLTPRWWRL